MSLAFSGKLHLCVNRCCCGGSTPSIPQVIENIDLVRDLSGPDFSLVVMELDSVLEGVPQTGSAAASSGAATSAQPCGLRCDLCGLAPEALWGSLGKHAGGHKGSESIE